VRRSIWILGAFAVVAAGSVPARAGGVFNTGSIGGGTQDSAQMQAAGRFPYHCNFHAGMDGVLRVRLKLSDSSVPDGTSVTVRYGAASAPETWRYDLQRKRGDGNGRAIRTMTAAETFTFTPGRAGTLRFRSRAQNAGGAASGWSPPATLTVT
jgi:hypothetical protein